MKIAVVNSDPEQAELVRHTLSAIGHTCQHYSNGNDFLEQIHRADIDLLVIDAHLPDLPVLDVAHAVRSNLPSLPVLLLVGRADEEEVVVALAAGISDYQVKPLRRGELAMRVQTLLKRSYPERQAETVRFGSYAFEPETGHLAIKGMPIELTQKEFALALLFFRNLDRPLSRAYIQENIWSRDADIPSRTMDTHVSRVRNKLGLRPENGFRLAPVYSYGYRLEQLAA